MTLAVAKKIKEGEIEEVEVAEDKIKSKLELIQKKKKKCKKGFLEVELCLLNN